MNRLSYAYGPGGLPKVYRSIPSLLEHRAAEIPNKPAHIFRYRLPDDSQDLISGRTVLTFKEISDRSFNVAASLLETGLKCGDTVAVIGMNCPEWVILEYACSRLGVLLVKMQPAFTTPQTFCRVVSDTRSKFIVVDPDNSLRILVSAFPRILSTNNFTELGLNSVEKIFLLRDNHLQSCPNIKEMSFRQPPDHLIEKLQDLQTAKDPDEVSLIYQTSGSTGIPKLVVYSDFRYINMVSHAFLTMFSVMENPEDMILFNDRPFSWAGSMVYAPSVLGLSLVHLAPEVIISGSAIATLFNVLADEKVTCALLLQYMLFDAMQAQKNSSFIPPTLKAIVTAGESIPQDILEFSLTTFSSLKVGYVSVECTALSSARIEYQQDGMIDLNWYELFSDCELKLVDDHGSVVPIGEPGTVNVRSPYSICGYMREGRVVKLESDWIDLQDVGIMRENGCFKMIGRKKDVISRGGAKVYPKLLENVLNGHDRVGSAVVVGVPDPRLYQEVCACILKKPGEDLTEADLRKFFSEQIQANAISFAPKYYLFIDHLPKGSTGKVDRLAITKLAIDKFGLSNE